MYRSVLTGKCRMLAYIFFTKDYTQSLEVVEGVIEFGEAGFGM